MVVFDENKIKNDVSIKRKLAKIFRNVFFASILFFLITVAGFKFFNFETSLLKDFALVFMTSLLAVEAVVGGLFFLLWILILILPNVISEFVVYFFKPIITPFVRTKKAKIITISAASFLILFVAFYSYGMFLIYKINKTAENISNLRQQYNANLKDLGLNPQGLLSDTGGMGNNRIIELYGKNDVLIKEIRDNTTVLGKDIKLAKRIIIPRKYRVDLLDKYEEVLRLDLRIIDEIASPANDFDQVMAEYWTTGYMKATEIINNITEDIDRGDKSNMQGYLEEMKKINRMHKIYEEKVGPVLNEVYKEIPNHKKDYRIWLRHEGDYYLYWEKYNEAIVNRDNKNISYYTDKINNEGDWLAANPSKEITDEVIEGRIFPWNVEIGEIGIEEKKLWNEIYLLKPFYLPKVTFVYDVMN